MGNLKKQRRKNGDGNWGKRTINGSQYIYFRKYYPCIDTEKTFYGKNEKEVKKKQEKFENSIDSYKKINLKNIPAETFYSYMKYWIVNIKPFDGSDTRQVTLDSYEEIIDSRIKDSKLGSIQIASLNQDEFDSYLRDYCIKTKKYSRATIKRTLCIVRQYCDYLYDKNFIKENYAQNLIIPTEERILTKKKEVPFLEESDMDKLYNEWKENKKNYGINAYAVVFIMYTGLRISECMALKWKDVDFNNNIITVSHTVVRLINKDGGDNRYIYVDNSTTKSDSGYRSIPLAPRALEILNELYKKTKSKDDYVFLTSSDNPIMARNVTRTLNKMQLNSKCEVSKCGLHSLRHSFGSYLILEGTDIKTVSMLLGHSSVEITLNIYVHIINKQKVAAIKIFEKHEQKDILTKCKESGINIIEIEDGMLGYIENGKIIKLPITKEIIVNDISYQCKNIYDEYYN